MRNTRGFTVIELLIVSVLIALVAAVAIPCLLRSQQVARQAHACASMKTLVSHEVIWRDQDLDRNGVKDYWVRDVRGLYGVADTAGRPLALLDMTVARADRDPAFAYGAPIDVTTPDQGYYLQAMRVDQSGDPYVDASLPAATAAPAGGNCTNRYRFGFVACPAVQGSDGTFLYRVAEDGVIWQRDGSGSPQILDRSLMPPTEWIVSGG